MLRNLKPEPQRQMPFGEACAHTFSSATSITLRGWDKVNPG